MPFGIILDDIDPERECWHEAGHAIVGHHLGMTISGIGFSWRKGPHHDPDPTTWAGALDGFDKDTLATQFLAGMAAEIVKFGDHDWPASRSDKQAARRLGCAFSDEHYIDRATEILVERDAALVRVYNRLMEERINPSYEPFVDSDGMKKQVHLTQADFESLL